MNNMERAIRNALAKADAYSPAARRRVYEAAWAAQERALEVSTALTDEQKESRRSRLKAAIRVIEQEYTAHSTSRPEPELSTPVEQDPVPGNAQDTAIPSLDAADIRTNARASRRARARDDRPEKATGKQRHSAFFRLGLSVLVLLIAGLIGYSLYNSFSDLSRQPAPGLLTQEMSHAPLKQGEEPDDIQWVTIFTPSNATKMSLKGRATAEIKSDGLHSYVRVQSPGKADSVSFAIGEGILDRIAGKKATFDIIARADDGSDTQMAVECDLAGLGDCGRRRYDVGSAVSDYLFDLDLPQGKRAGRAGSITINSDFNGSGKPVNILGIRVSVSEQ
ncbi:hypothetical protein ACFO1V_13910 [Daeguia caeni]|uniref:Biotin transporter BioY n=1 Tax=Daeguia caeni TaxID=439612 RepID=A0ABV9HAE2_9HYPH